MKLRLTRETMWVCSTTVQASCLSHKHLSMPKALSVTPFLLMMMGPTRPLYVSAVSAECPWYIQTTDDGSPPPGPALAGTCAGISAPCFSRLG